MVALSSYKFPAANLICQISEKGALTLANIFEKLQISEIKVCRLYFLIYFYKISIYLCIHCFIAFLTYSFDLPIWPIHLNYLNYIILPHPYNLSQYLQCFFNTHCCCQLKRWHWTCKYNSLKTLQVRIRVDVKSCMDWTLCSVCATTRGVELFLSACLFISSVDRASGGNEPRNVQILPATLAFWFLYLHK